MLLEKLSDYFRHEFRAISRVRPIVWILLYVIVIPIFALIYYWLPDTQFRIPDNAPTDFGSWLYYSIVTITTLGFGDYTPSHGWAQTVTAVEVMCGLLFLGFFLNAVGSLKSENDVSAEVEKQRKLHEAQETDKLKKSIPAVMRTLSIFLSGCYTTQELLQNPETAKGIDIKDADMHLRKSAFNTALSLDSLQMRVDLTLWPELLEDCFKFVANFQVFNAENTDNTKLVDEFIADNLPIAAHIEEELKAIANQQ